MKTKKFYTTKFGIEFVYKGDTVIWVFPWKRTIKGQKWISLSFEAGFKSLKELDKCWEGYFEAERWEVEAERDIAFKEALDEVMERYGEAFEDLANL